MGIPNIMLLSWERDRNVYQSFQQLFFIVCQVAVWAAVGSTKKLLKKNYDITKRIYRCTYTYLRLFRDNFTLRVPPLQHSNNSNSTAAAATTSPKDRIIAQTMDPSWKRINYRSRTFTTRFCVNPIKFHY